MFTRSQEKLLAKLKAADGELVSAAKLTRGFSTREVMRSHLSAIQKLLVVSGSRDRIENEYGKGYRYIAADKPNA